MNKKYLLSGVMAGIALLYANEGMAQCVTTQSCAALGYTETSCAADKKGVKCPFGNTWSCIPNVLCTSNYKYSCSGANQTGGAGTACNGKYTKCTCASSYVWQDGSCQQLNGAKGELYYCNGTVVGVKASGMDFYVAMKDLGKINWNSANSQCKSYVFCGNIKGTLPSQDQLLTIFNNESTINNLLSTNGGTKLTESYYWSSTPSYNLSYYLINVYYGSVKTTWDYTVDSYYVRPILASY